jgi:endonuclease/exonuclease/phosphatase family metal-dependent hydrolase
MSHARPWRAAAVTAACASLLAALPATAAAKPQDLKVMVRNVYLGADIVKLATPTNREDFERNATELFQIVQQNDYATRAKALAAEIRATKPDVIGVQEAAIWRTGPKDDPAPAANVVYDSTEVLLKELASLGQQYRVAGGRDWLDVEGPTTTQDVRLVQRDVVLVRRNSKMKVNRSFQGGYTEHFDVQTQAGLAQSLRGWVGIDATLAGRKFRFVTTHLEAYIPATAEAQAKQLMSGPLASKRRPSILVGDFNSDPSSSGTSDERGVERLPKAYQAIIKADFVNPMPRRLTCCYKELLTDPDASGLDEWLDHIMVRPRMRVLNSRIVGNRMSGGLWPSDHQGVFATIRLK